MKPSAYRPLEITWRLHVAPRWENVRLTDVGYSDVQEWLTELAEKLSATVTLRAYGVLAGILDVAVRDRRISSNPARGVVLPRKNKKRHVYLSDKQVEALATESRDHGTLVRLLAYTGLRWGEAVALRIDNIDIERRRLQVDENAVMVGGDIVVGTPKTHKRRSCPVPGVPCRAARTAMRGEAESGPSLRRRANPPAPAGSAQGLVRLCEEAFRRARAADYS